MQSAAQKRDQQQLVSKLKRLVVRNGGMTGVRALTRAFNLADDNCDHHLDRHEFAQCLRSFGIILQDAEVDTLVRMFDIDGDGNIGIAEFLTVFRVGLNPKRRAFIERCFDRFDQNGDGKLTLAELRSSYNASAHPAVLKREMTEEQVLDAFLNDFDDAANPDGCVSKQEFEQRCSGLSATIANDDEFIEVMCATWGLDDQPLVATHRRPLSQLTINEREREVDNVLCLQKAEAVANKLRKLVEEKLPMRLHQLSRELRKHDPGRTGFMGLAAFEQAVHDCLLHYFLSEADINALFEGFDTRRTGELDYLSLLNTLSGDLPPRRLVALERTWRLFPRDPKGFVPVRYLHDNFIADYLPDVAAGSMGKGKGLSDFFTHWDAKHYPTGKVSFHEFCIYYHTAASELHEDAHFETMIKVSWSVWEAERKMLVAALG